MQSLTDRYFLGKDDFTKSTGGFLSPRGASGHPCRGFFIFMTADLSSAVVFPRIDGTKSGTVSGTREGRGFPVEPSSTVSLFLFFKRLNTKSTGGASDGS